MSSALTATRLDLFEATSRSLQREPKELPPVWLYDERGSLLYEAITRLPDYYLPRRRPWVYRLLLGYRLLSAGDFRGLASGVRRRVGGGR